MTDLDAHIAKQSIDDKWAATFKHYLAHYRNWDSPDLECPGGDKCTLLPPEAEEENTED